MTGEKPMLLFSESPYVSTLKCHLWNGEYCFSCCNYKEKKSNRCAGCHTAYYCSAECQEKDWKTGQHDKECGFLNIVRKMITLSKTKSSEEQQYGHDVLQTTFLIAKLAGRWSADGGHNQQCEVTGVPSDVKLRTVDDLQANELSQEREEFAETCWRMFGFIFDGKYMIKIDKQLFLHYFKLLTTNQIGIAVTHFSSGVQTIIAVGLYLQLSRFDHSCDPDLNDTVDPDSTVKRNWFLIKPRKTDFHFDDLHISYGIDWKTNTEVRRSRLSLYQFECQCPMCIDAVGDLIRQFSLNQSCPECNEVLVFVHPSRSGRSQVNKARCLRCNYVCTKPIPLDDRNAIVDTIDLIVEEKKQLLESQSTFDQTFTKVEKLLHPKRNVILLCLRGKKVEMAKDLDDYIKQSELMLATFDFYQHPDGNQMALRICANVVVSLLRKQRIEEGKMWIKSTKNRMTAVYGDGEMMDELDKMLLPYKHLLE